MHESKYWKLFKQGDVCEEHMIYFSFLFPSENYSYNSWRMWRNVGPRMTMQYYCIEIFKKLKSDFSNKFIQNV